ncbi:MAG: DUF362 domain-containing protein, partial [Clostridia bacterium]|nr:DUF362 domain-containing protein [Clostridia bacterium]
MTGSNENKIFLGVSSQSVYPINDNVFSPSEAYPEYLFNTKSLSVNNHVYSLIREGFNKLGYDLENYNSKNWNPLKDLVKEGDTVLIKPNWVMHYNKNNKYKNNLDCLITHPSIVRVLVDYVLIALKGTGRIIIADAPIQSCNLNLLLEKHGYYELFDFYKNNKKEIEVLD